MAGDRAAAACRGLAGCMRAAGPGLGASCGGSVGGRKAADGGRLLVGCWQRCRHPRRRVPEPALMVFDRLDVRRCYACGGAMPSSMGCLIGGGDGALKPF